MKVVTVSLILLLLAFAAQAAPTFYTKNNCDFTANVQMQMGGDHTMTSDGFTLDAGKTGEIPIDSTGALSGTLYFANTLPASVAEFMLHSGRSGDTDFYGISLSRGSVSLAISPTSVACKPIKCHTHSHCPSKMVPCPSGGDYIITFCP